MIRPPNYAITDSKCSQAREATIHMIRALVTMSRATDKAVANCSH